MGLSLGAGKLPDFGEEVICARFLCGLVRNRPRRRNEGRLVNVIECDAKCLELANQSGVSCPGCI